MIYCFDTSAFNRLLDDPHREIIEKAMLAGNSFRISAYNVVEAAKTKSEARRHELVRLMRRLTENKRPLDRPNTLVRAAARAFAEKKRTVTVNADPDLDGVWVALNRPEFLDEQGREESLKWAKEWSEDFDTTVSDMRNEVQKMFEGKAEKRPRTPAVTVRSYFKNRDHIYERLVGPIYERETGKQLGREEFEDLMREPVWMLYFGAYAYGFHQRAVRQHGYSKNKHAGAIDLGQAVYLTMCDRFITDDRAQYRALRLTNVCNSKRDTEVLLYDVFRRRLLPFG